ncbi:hypothetical protein Rsub_12458 [Raphidocelis subcapitata]|uniref:NADH:ubiquinone oxidoreductase intermediate-associated protein 30 domain-containing protein n=1 Tax=Raphidocelis subcapitata TaxID=307507 RepID=A0A2V0PHZ6_9CHLO|nr:hypothetical protein Rsub_12458 [Raphidocelis subcapitata]|eukprot:GBF99199.1 hypothetical protein Rsub_12458 [Raphidocelis subcapitata]
MQALKSSSARQAAPRRAAARPAAAPAPLRAPRPSPARRAPAPARAAPEALDPTLLLAGGAALLGLIGFGAAAGLGAAPAPPAGASEAAAAEAALPRDNAVLVFGSKGRTGRLVVQQLLRAGRTVVAAVRSAEKASGVFAEIGLNPGAEAAGPGTGSLILLGDVDVTDAASLRADLFRGCTQVVIALGAVAGRLPDGSMGYTDGGSPKEVEGKGVSNILAAMAANMEPGKRELKEVLPMRSEEDLAIWERTFRMAVAPSQDGRGAVFAGDLQEDGGACAARTRPLGLDLSGYDGLCLRVKSDGQTFQIDLRQEGGAEAYEALIETPDTGDWATVRLPFHDFVAVKGGDVDPDADVLTGAGISELSLALSQFTFNRLPNPRYHPGRFELEVDGGLSVYRDPRPQLVVLSSAGVERVARPGGAGGARSNDAELVRSNPGAVLNWKYEAECAIRASRFPYAVVRCTALDEESAESAAQPCLLEADQGDLISGRVARAEAAAVIVAALGAPDAAGKTFELRRSEAVDAAGRGMGQREFLRLFLKLVPDTARWRAGLPPFPAVTLPPAAPAPAPAPAAEAVAAAAPALAVAAAAAAVAAPAAPKNGAAKKKPEPPSAAEAPASAEAPAAANAEAKAEPEAEAADKAEAEAAAEKAEAEERELVSTSA